MSGGGETHCAEWSYSSMLRGLREAPMSRGGPCAAERRPRAADRGPCAERRPSVPLRGGPCAAERRPLCRREEAPVPGGGPLCRKVFCAERIGGGPCVGRRTLCREEALYAGRYCPLR